MAREDIPLDLLEQTIRWREEKKRGKREKKKKDRKEEDGERSSTFSLEFLAIKPSVSVRTRGEVLPSDECFV